MPKPRSAKVKHPDKILQEATDFLEYHVNMYVHTFKLLVEKAYKQAPKGITTNSVLESHMMHFRVIAQFLSKEDSWRDTDVLAVDFFHDQPGVFIPLKDPVVDEWCGKVGSWMVHITTYPIEPKLILKSQQAWPTIELATRILPALNTFVKISPDHRFKKGHKEAIQKHLSEIKIQDGSAS